MPIPASESRFISVLEEKFRRTGIAPVANIGMACWNAERESW
jgi:hypothetical protein